MSLAALAPHVLEEAYETCDALGAGDDGAVEKELGDLLLNVLLAARIAEDGGRFSLEGVCDAITDKLVRRHPHVFADREVSGVGDVLKNWEEIKRLEREKDDDPSTLAGIPPSMPALLRSYGMGEKAASVGFEWPDLTGAVDKLDEEVAELKQALAGDDRRAIDEELGDALFSLVNIARHVKIDPETALRRTADRFDTRFRYLETHLGKSMKDATLAEMEALWRAAKRETLDVQAGVPEGAPTEWRACFLALFRARRALLDAVVDLPPDVFMSRPPTPPNLEGEVRESGGREWSIADVLEHLLMVDRSVAAGLGRALASGERAGSLVPFPSEGLAAHPPANEIVLPEGRVASPEVVDPTGEMGRDEVLDGLKAARVGLLSLAPRLAEVSPRCLLLPHPILGPLDAQQWMVFIAGHERRHLAQIDRIRRAVIG